MKFIKTVFAAAFAALGVLASLATILGYLKVDPSDATGTVGSALYLAAPAITFVGGALSGWGITKIWSDWKMAKKDAELKKRPTQEDVNNLKKEHAEAIAKLKERISGPEDSSRKFQDQVRTPSGKLCCNMTAVRTLPTETVGAMLDAYDHGGRAELGGHEECVRRSIANEDGIFRLGTMWFNGMPGDPDGTYLLTNEWKSFMDDHEVLAAMRDLARATGPVWQTL